VDGRLYGTTSSGGGGTVFSVNPSTGKEKVLYTFCSRGRRCLDGTQPNSLTFLNGRFYGTTYRGGTGLDGKGHGTVFALNPATRTEKVLYSFCSKQNCVDGNDPGSLIGGGGMLYGTTNTGGAGDNNPCPSCGTAFSVDPRTGAETVLYSFCSQQNCTDGSNPNPTLMDINGTLYGATIGGGAHGCGNGQACGTVFSLDPNTGMENVLYSFGNGGADGKYPEAGVIAVNGVLYGTTYAGGIAGCGPFGCGTVFSLDLGTGVENVLYSFCGQQNCTDGASPFSPLLEMDGTLYGTTSAGGTGCGGNGCGTVFSVDAKTGAETVLYSFCSQENCTDGANPYAGLIAVKGKLYGTTQNGGAHGVGTVFVLTRGARH
jgi:uncharacterized repeat protein (TIGR03803 family)